MTGPWILPAGTALAVALLAAAPASTASEPAGYAVSRPAEFLTAPKAGDPLANVGLTLEGGRTVLSARTNAKGEAVFSNLRAGTFTITVTPINDPPSAKLTRIGGVIIISGTPPQKLAASFGWGKGRPSAATGQDSRRIVIPVARDGGEVRVRLSIFDRWGNQ